MADIFSGYSTISDKLKKYAASRVIAPMKKPGKMMPFSPRAEAAKKLKMDLEKVLARWPEPTKVME